MKKKLESELISIAHRILKLKNKSELNQLHTEARILYEKLSVLKFVEENFEDIKPTIGRSDVEDKLESATFDAQLPDTTEPVAPEVVQPETAAGEEIKPEEIKPEEAQPEVVKPEPEADPEPEKQEEGLPEPAPETQPEEKNDEDAPAPEQEQDQVSSAETATEPAFKPAFEWGFEQKQENTQQNEPRSEEKPAEIKKQPGQIAFDDLLGSSYVDPVFVKPEELEDERRNRAVKIDIPSYSAPERRQSNDDIAHITVSLNDRLSKGITVGLNDRVAFVKHLFNNSSEDYNRVLSQLITFDTFAEAQEFIDQMVKPDYNNWNGKDEYAARFMELIEKKFS